MRQAPEDQLGVGGGVRGQELHLGRGLEAAGNLCLRGAPRLPSKEGGLRELCQRPTGLRAHAALSAPGAGAGTTDLAQNAQGSPLG